MQSGLQRNPAALSGKSQEIAAIPQLLLSNWTRESVAFDSASCFCALFLCRADAQSGFSDSVRRMPSDHEPMMWRKRDVSHKPDRAWTPKAYKEREIPIPAKLVKSLKAWKAKADKTCGLVFPTAGCKPKLDFLDCLKAVAERAKLDQDNFWLHKFRATFATRCLWAGVDLRTVQQWLGHSDMESTMRYLKPSRSQHVRDKVNAIFV
jgi:integrase